MKSLRESLFSQDLTSSEHPYEKLLKTNLRMRDVIEMVNEMDVGDFDRIKNKEFKAWAQNWFDNNVKPSTPPYLREFGTFGLIEDPAIVAPTSNDIEAIEQEQKDVFNYLKPGKIHNDFHRNDAMYANTFDISWTFWGPESDWKNITEWIVWKGDGNYSNYIMVLMNRKEYNEWDQMIIHKMIETVSKKGAH